MGREMSRHSTATLKIPMKMSVRRSHGVFVNERKIAMVLRCRYAEKNLTTRDIAPVPSF